MLQQLPCRFLSRHYSVFTQQRISIVNFTAVILIMKSEVKSRSYLSDTPAITPELSMHTNTYTLLEY